ncbi:hypothetical protein BGZ73_005961 [Actinomortierella ambigua]|nr:hypothetical protein BGZ73_005961 [Actinomortierella ambigua]
MAKLFPLLLLSIWVSNQPRPPSSRGGISIGLTIDPRKLLRLGGRHRHRRRSHHPLPLVHDEADIENMEDTTELLSKRAVSHTGNDRAMGTGNTEGQGPWSKRAVSHTGDDRSPSGGGGGGNDGYGYGIGGGGGAGAGGGDGGSIYKGPWSKRAVSHTGDDRSSDGGGGGGMGGSGGWGGEGGYFVKRDTARSGDDRAGGPSGGGGGHGGGEGGYGGGEGGHVGGGGEGGGGDGIGGYGIHLLSEPGSQPQRRNVLKLLEGHEGEEAAASEPQRRDLYRRSGHDYVPIGTGSGNTYDKGQPFGRSL